jgi:hypothetical protein
MVFCPERLFDFFHRLRSQVSGDWSWRNYAINRSVRLYVVLIPGLLLGFF